MKSFANTYLYNQYPEYEKNIFSFVMTGTEIDKGIPEFDDIYTDVKRRQVSAKLVKILMSDKVVLMISEKPLPKAFKVICIKDVKGGSNEKKIYIDCTGVIVKNSSGRYVCTSNNVDILISYLVAAMHTMIYYIDTKRLDGNAKLNQAGVACFSSLMTHVVDYVAKISVMGTAKTKCIYLSSLYYLANILDKDIHNESIKRIAINQAKISVREAEMIDMQLDPNSFINIKFFAETLAKILRISKLSLDVIVEKWMYLYGPGTVFGLELFPSFATMITDTYVGCYINNQKTIEKITGNAMVEFSKTIIQIGSDAV